MLRKRHLYITRAVYPAEVGGPANTVYEFAKVSDNITVLSSDRGMTSEAKLKFGIKLGSLNIINGAKIYLYKSFLQSPFSLGLVCWLMKNIKSYDYIHVHSFFAPSSLFSAICALLFNKKLIIHSHGELLGPALHNKNMLKKITMSIYKLIYSNSYAFAATSKDEAISIANCFDNEIIMLSNAIDVGEIKCTSKKGNYFLYVGRLDPIKNLELLINSYNEFIQENKEKKSKLVLAGTGNPAYVASLVNLVNKNGLDDLVEFTGHVVGDQKKIIYQNSLALFLISKSENFGNVVMEALAYGKPVVTSTGTPWDVTEYFECGIRVDYIQKNISNAFRDLSVMSKENYVKKSLSSRFLAEKHYDSKIVVDNFINKLENL